MALYFLAFMIRLARAIPWAVPCLIAVGGCGVGDDGASVARSAVELRALYSDLPIMGPSEPIAILGEATATNEAEIFTDIESMALGPEGTVYLSDAAAGIRALTYGGEFLWEGALRGEGPNEADEKVYLKSSALGLDAMTPNALVLSYSHRGELRRKFRGNVNPGRPDREYATTLSRTMNGTGDLIHLSAVRSGEAGQTAPTVLMRTSFNDDTGSEKVEVLGEWRPWWKKDANGEPLGGIYTEARGERVALFWGSEPRLVLVDMTTDERRDLSVLWPSANVLIDDQGRVWVNPATREIDHILVYSWDGTPIFGYKGFFPSDVRGDTLLYYHLDRESGVAEARVSTIVPVLQ